MRLLAIIISGVILAITGSLVVMAAPARLPGAWRVVSIDGAPPPGRAGVTLDFEPDGRLSGQAPCNRYHAGYRIEGQRIVFSPGATTRMFCGEEIMRAEQRFLGMLGGGAVWSISSDGLRLTADSGAVLTATRSRAR